MPGAVTESQPIGKPQWRKRNVESTCDSMTIMPEPSALHLSLWRKQLGRVPDAVWENTELEGLVLADNGLTEVSSRIGGLKNLRMLDLGHNKLTSVPDALCDLVLQTSCTFTTIA